MGYLSLTSLVACLAVVMMHANGCFWYFDTKPYWFSANIIESVCYFAVPVFFMMTGCNLLDYRERYSTKVFFQKRIQKTVIPFIAWSMIAIFLLPVFQPGWTLENVTLRTLIDVILNCRLLAIYWFFICLFAIYLCVPVLSAIPKKLRREVYGYLVAASLIFNIALPFLCTLIGFSYNSNLYVTVGMEFVSYVVLGYLLSHETIGKRLTALIYAAGLAGLLMHIIGTYVLSTQAGEIISTYKGYTNLPCFLYSAAMFLFLKNVGEKISGKWLSIINSLGGYTFGVYLTHWYALEILKRFFHGDIYSLAYRLGGAVLAMALCMIGTAIAQKIPLIKRIVP